MPGDVAVEVAAPAPTDRLRHEIGERLEARGVPLRQLIPVEDRGQLRRPLPWRDGRREGSFSDCLDSITSRSL